MKPAAPDIWDEALFEWRAARAAELAFDRANIDPAFDEAERTGGIVDPAISAESERLADKRDTAEERLISVPAPNAEAVVVKFLIAFGNGRFADAYLDRIEADAVRLCGTAWEA